MRVWMDKGRCFLRNDDGEVQQVAPQWVDATLDGEHYPPIFEADDKEGWALVALGERGNPPYVWHFIPDETEPHGCKTEVRRGKVEIMLPDDGTFYA